MGALRLDKAWIALTDQAIAALPGQLGVYQLADSDGAVLKIGMADARQPFGLRSALGDELARGQAVSFRYERTHGYRTRWQELLMLHQAEHGSLPPGNVDDARHLGRLSPGGR